MEVQGKIPIRPMHWQGHRTLVDPTEIGSFSVGFRAWELKYPAVYKSKRRRRKRRFLSTVTLRHELHLTRVNEQLMMILF